MSPDTQNPRNVDNKPAHIPNLEGFQKNNQLNKPRAFVVSAFSLSINLTTIIQYILFAVSNDLSAAEL